MFKILLALLLMTPMAWATQWRGGTGEQTILGTSNAALIGYNSYNSIVQPLDNLLATYCNEVLSYNSTTIINVSSGSCAVSNSQGSIRLFLLDPATTTLSSSNLDTGSFVASTTYYVYSTAASNSATTSTYYISASNTAPSGQTYYYKIGSFAMDSNTNIIASSITMSQGLNVSHFGSYSSKSAGVVYQAATDGVVVAYSSGSSQDTECFGYSGSTNSPPQVWYSSDRNNTGTSRGCGMSFPVAKGNYWETTFNTNGSTTINFVSLGN